MIDDFMTWANKINFDEIGKLDMNYFDNLRKYYVHGYYNTDKEGHPLYIEQMEYLQPSKIFKDYSDDDLVKYYV